MLSVFPVRRVEESKLHAQGVEQIVICPLSTNSSVCFVWLRIDMLLCAPTYSGFFSLSLLLPFCVASERELARAQLQTHTNTINNNKSLT